MIEAAAAIGGVMAGLKELRSIVKGIENSEVIQKVFDVQQGVLELQAALSALEEENRGLRNQNAELKQALETQDSAVFHDGAYWQKSHSGYEGPFCSLCLESNGRLVRMSLGASGSYYCSLHRGAASVKSHPPRE